MCTGEDEKWTAPVVGTCRLMCPTSEVKLRHDNQLLHCLEITDESKFKPVGKWEPDVTRMVKEYRRPAAGKLELDPELLRPPDVLLRTCHYLMLCAASEKTAAPWNTVYGFVFDRLRAIRQDMVIQRIGGPHAIQILEMAVKFHVYSGYRLCEEKDVSIFDSHINATHAIECMKRLMVLYESCESPGTDKNRPFYTALYLLFNLTNDEALFYVLKRIDLFRDSPDMRRALTISLAYTHRNFVKFLRLMSSSPPLLQCALHRHLSKIYLDAMSVMVTAYNSKNLYYNLDDLTALLKFDSKAQVENLCQLSGLTCSEQGVNLNKSTYFPPKNLDSSRVHWIDKGLNSSILAEIKGESGSMKGVDSSDSNVMPRSRGRGRGRGRGCAGLKAKSN